MIGTFGPLVFEASGLKILTPSGFTQEVAGRWGEHETISGKPLSQFGGPGLRSISFELRFRTSFGTKPREMLEMLEDIVETGQHFPLIIGGQPIGKNHFYIPTLPQEWGEVLNGGELVSAKASLSLKEYKVR